MQVRADQLPGLLRGIRADRSVVERARVGHVPVIRVFVVGYDDREGRGYHHEYDEYRRHLAQCFPVHYSIT